MRSLSSASDSSQRRVCLCSLLCVSLAVLGVLCMERGMLFIVSWHVLKVLVKFLPVGRIDSHRLFFMMSWLPQKPLADPRLCHVTPSLGLVPCSQASTYRSQIPFPSFVSMFSLGFHALLDVSVSANFPSLPHSFITHYSFTSIFSFSAFSTFLSFLIPPLISLSW